MHAAVVGVCVCAGVQNHACEELAPQLAAKREQALKLACACAGLDLEGNELAIFAFDHEVDLLAGVCPPMSKLHGRVEPAELLAHLAYDERLE